MSGGKTRKSAARKSASRKSVARKTASRKPVARKSKKPVTRKSASKKHAVNTFFKLMLEAKRKNLPSFKYKSKTYKGVKHPHLGMIYRKA